MKISIYRYLPEQDDASRMQAFELELGPNEGMMVSHCKREQTGIGSTDAG